MMVGARKLQREWLGCRSYYDMNQEDTIRLGCPFNGDQTSNCEQDLLFHYIKAHQATWQLRLWVFNYLQSEPLSIK